MSVECGECERDARGGHGDDCTIGLKREIEQLNQKIKELEIIQALTEGNFNDYCEDKKHEVEQLKKENEIQFELLEQFAAFLKTGDHKRVDAKLLAEILTKNKE